MGSFLDYSKGAFTDYLIDLEIFFQIKYWVLLFPFQYLNQLNELISRPILIRNLLNQFLFLILWRRGTIFICSGHIQLRAASHSCVFQFTDLAWHLLHLPFIFGNEILDGAGRNKTWRRIILQHRELTLNSRFIVFTIYDYFIFVVQIVALLLFLRLTGHRALKHVLIILHILGPFACFGIVSWWLTTSSTLRCLVRFVQVGIVPSYLDSWRRIEFLNQLLPLLLRRQKVAGIVFLLLRPGLVLLFQLLVNSLQLLQFSLVEVHCPALAVDTASIHVKDLIWVPWGHVERLTLAAI